MTVATDQIITEIKDYIRTCGGQFRHWYVGIATDAKTRLFSDHQVQEQGGAWIYFDAGTHQKARQIEEYLVNQFDMRGGTGGGSTTTCSVYAYKITAYTVQ